MTFNAVFYNQRKAKNKLQMQYARKYNTSLEWSAPSSNTHLSKLRGNPLGPAVRGLGTPGWKAPASLLEYGASTRAGCISWEPERSPHFPNFSWFQTGVQRNEPDQITNQKSKQPDYCYRKVRLTSHLRFSLLPILLRRHPFQEFGGNGKKEKNKKASSFFLLLQKEWVLFFTFRLKSI